MSILSKEKLFSYLFHFLFLLLLASIVFSWRAVSSICFGLLLLACLFKTDIYQTGYFRRSSFSIVVVSCFLLFVLTCVSLAYTTNTTEGLSQVQKKSGIIVIPLSIYLSQWFLNKNSYRQLMNYFTVFVFSASVICLANSVAGYLNSGDSYRFFYHALVSPINQHAIQFSILVFFNLLFLFECLRGDWILSARWLAFLLFFFTVMLVLLSSKLILLVYLAWLIYYIFWQRKTHIRKAAPVLVLSLVLVIGLFSTSNPFSNRFRLLFSGNKALFLQDKFDHGTYFNGIQFRLLQWRFTGEILSENKAWAGGVGPGDAQDLLNAKYEEKNMFTGKPGETKGGYWNYHTHNQFLQTLLQNGLTGLTILLLFWTALLRCTWKSRDPSLKFSVLTLFLYCFSDAPFETQYGIVLLIFLPLFSYLSHRFSKELQELPNTLATK